MDFLLFETSPNSVFLFVLLSIFRYFSSRSVNCCIPGKKAKSQKTRVKTDTRISSPVSHTAACHFLPLQLPVESDTNRQHRGLSRACRVLLWWLTAFMLCLGRGQNLVWSHKAVDFLLCTNSFYFVFSVDTTRVEIREMDPDVPGSDYINANYIRVSVFSIR